MYIAIVGLGASGNGVLKTLIDFQQNHPGEEMVIHIFDEKNHLGHGFAYQNDDHRLIMNSLPQDLSIDDQNPNDLLEWLGEHYPKYQDVEYFIPRPVYGEYLKDRMSAYLGHEHVHIMEQSIQDIEVVDANGQVITGSQQGAYHYHLQTTDDNWQPVTYKAVFLTIGHPPYADHYQLLGHQGYIHDPYPVSEHLAKLDPNKKIGIIGSGLTGLDVMRYLQYHFEGQLKRSITFFTRSTPFSTAKQGRYDGHIHTAFSNEWIKSEREKGKGYIPLDRILQAFLADMKTNNINIQRTIDRYGTGSLTEIRQELNHFDRDLQIFQQYAGVITPFLPDLYMSMSVMDRMRYDQDYLGIFEHFRSQMTKEALQDIIQWYDEDKITFHDQLTDIKPNSESGFDLFFENGSPKHVDILINAAGFENDLAKASEQNLFIKNLLDRDILTPKSNGGVMVTWPQVQVTSQRFATHDNLFLTGRWIMTTQYGNNNAQMTFSFGQQVAQQFLQHTLKS